MIACLGLFALSAYMVMQKWLEDFVYRVEIGWDIFLYTAAIALFIALFIIGQQAFRAAMTDPLMNLRSE